jgi:hypothetical protein
MLKHVEPVPPMKTAVAPSGPPTLASRSDFASHACLIKLTEGHVLVLAVAQQILNRARRDYRCGSQA